MGFIIGGLIREDLKRKNYAQNLKLPMIDLRQKNFVEASIKRNDMKLLKFLRRYLALLRFGFMSHKRARFGKRITSFFVFAIMIVDIVLLPFGVLFDGFCSKSSCS